ncbi:MAG: GGDEF domain-containing protein [Gammaproteobacteria bacterium]|uniref:GGDEF domain-containing protein n=1 Tax=Rhodoferax sp. TaxID=50421 RepID=UPI001835B8B7|nr:GGDEF domain-containing protein [Rhodoferax sp.]MBU3898628.1 GGDEF domain-containing protein [Gammaproteobacteria bacterium]MBA3059182.1 GGDEF domain-containing protein [Rhodoferax sp.]MBU3997731.1 GGDEF domain-containing protein [Gammaproteobacteria bacterium]MBU4019537.1 GGDEF domain-containing protein [Gammaproteobacteria bacterium]MBU4079051.1 GGDEF domain-containing protein [Gammaproteobacteria bacterium]
MSHLVDKLADLTGLRDRDALDLALVTAIHDLLQPQSAAIYRVVGEAGNERWLSTAQMNADQQTPTFDSAWSDLLTLPRLLDYPLRQQASTTRQMAQSCPFSGITVFPVSSNPGSVGVLEIATLEPLSQESSRLVSGVLRLYLNFQNLLDYGERDALTELLNRKTFDGAFLKATLAQQVSVDNASDERRDISYTGSFWLAMIDIDHFKSVNDNFGHLIGDEVLLLLARLMRVSFRFHDQLYRFGGEEFVVLMRCNGEAEAAAALERLRTNTESYLFPQVGSITISIGFSEIKTGDTPSGAFERADKAVYYAKEHGRNQVCSHAALIASGALVEQASNVGDMELF